jgi:DNA polymerase-3 subunit alpha/error-prone DNA polymerase
MCRLLTHQFIKTHLPEVAPAFENVFVIYPTANMPNELRNFEYIGIRPVIKYSKPMEAIIQKRNPATRYFRSKKEFNLHRILRAIDNNTLLSN